MIESPVLSALTCKVQLVFGSFYISEMLSFVLNFLLSFL